MPRAAYEQQVELMLQVVPIVAMSNCFALKGGTAINFFLRDMPRLSIDLDLTYVPIESRKLSIENMNKEIMRIASEIHKSLGNVSVRESRSRDQKIINRLFIEQKTTMIKIEPNFILRGTLLPCKIRNLCGQAQDKYATFAEINTLSDADLYAGKLCAALDRQHPRDLFDIKMLYANGGITDEIFTAFIIYLASSPRPIHELLSPNILDIKSIFENEFLGMSIVPVTLEELENIRTQLLFDIKRKLTDKHKEFLLSIKQGEAKWELMPFQGLEKLPALQWKLMNIKKMDKDKHKLMLSKLISSLDS